MIYEKALEKLKGLYELGAYNPAFYSWRIPGPHSFKDYEAFQEIPFMLKDELRNAPAMQRTTTPLNEIYGVFSSSGTTGEKTYYVYSNEDKLVHEHFVKIFFSEFGVGPEDIGGIMAPIDTGVMAHTMMWEFNTVGAGYVNCPDPSPENMLDIVTKVPVTAIATRPAIASGVAYNPTLVELARQSQVTKLLMGGGFLSEERRKLLEYIWGAKCFNLLGTSEVFGPIAAECRYRDGLHFPSDYLMVEVIDPQSKNPVPCGTPGIAVYTTLWNKGFPLLRYWTNDLIILDCSDCRCGRPYPRIRFLGRTDDCFLVDGNYVFPESVENILFKYGCIGEYRVEKKQGRYLVKTESTINDVPQTMVDEFVELFKTEVAVSPLTPGSLHYDGHQLRFASLD